MVACPLGERGRPAAETLFHCGEDLGTVLAGERPGHDGVDDRFGQPARIRSSSAGVEDLGPELSCEAPHIRGSSQYAVPQATVPAHCRADARRGSRDSPSFSRSIAGWDSRRSVEPRGWCLGRVVASSSQDERTSAANRPVIPHGGLSSNPPRIGPHTAIGRPPMLGSSRLSTLTEAPSEPQGP
jgi:hypothetical protein